jgi:hypothetical protein
VLPVETSRAVEIPLLDAVNSPSGRPSAGSCQKRLLLSDGKLVRQSINYKALWTDQSLTEKLLAYLNPLG